MGLQHVEALDVLSVEREGEEVSLPALLWELVGSGSAGAGGDGVRTVSSARSPEPGLGNL